MNESVSPVQAPEDPRESSVENAQEVDPKSGRSDDPRVDPSASPADD